MTQRKRMQIKMSALKFSPASLAETIALIADGTISGKIAKELLPDLLAGAAEAGGVASFVEARGMGQISDEGKIVAMIQQVMAANPRLAAMRSQIRLDMTPDGLRLQIVDEVNRAMFDSGSAIVKPYMRELLREIAQVLGEVPNRLTLEGHTDAMPFVGGERGYSNWELSSDRANASRRELLAGGLPDKRVLRVQGLASSSLHEPADPLSPVNRRISIIVMNRDAEDRLLRSGGPLAEAAAGPGPSPNPSLRVAEGGEKAP